MWDANAAAAQPMVKLPWKEISRSRRQHCCPHGKGEGGCSGAFDPSALPRRGAQSWAGTLLRFEELTTMYGGLDSYSLTLHTWERELGRNKETRGF